VNDTGAPQNKRGGARIAKLPPRALDADQRAVYDAIVGGPRARGAQLFRLVDSDGALEGPFNAFLLQPHLGAALQALGSAVRYETTLSDRSREIAILVVAAHWDSSFEWYAHEAVGRHVGLTDDELDGIRAGSYDGLPGAEGVVALTADRLVRDGDLDDAAYSSAVATLGQAALFELLTLVGYYAALALQLRVYRVTEPSPDVP
jgi:4-carboxymuconolactone decarboxylase